MSSSLKYITCMMVLYLIIVVAGPCYAGANHINHTALSLFFYSNWYNLCENTNYYTNSYMGIISPCDVNTDSLDNCKDTSTSAPTTGAPDSNQVKNDNEDIDQEDKQVSTNEPTTNIVDVKGTGELNKLEYMTELMKIDAQSDSVQVGIIRKNIDSVCLARKDLGFFENYPPYEQVQSINKKWLLETATKNYDWFNDLKRRESQYYNTRNQLKENEDRKNTTEGELETINQEIINIKSNLSNQDNAKRQLFALRDSTVYNEFMAKLSTIPRSIVLVGRIKTMDNVLPDSLKEWLDESMKLYASCNTSGITSLSQEVMVDDCPLAYEIWTSEGKPQTVENYFQDVNKLINGENYVYRILRIEVSPFDTSHYVGGEKRTTNTEPGNSNIDLYNVLGDSHNLINVDTGDTTSFADHNMDIQAQDYLDFQANFSNILNDKYEQKIREAFESYENRRKEIDESVARIDASIINLNNRLNTKISDSAQKANLLQNLGSVELPRLRRESDSLKNDYEDFYNHKISFANKLVIILENQMKGLSICDQFEQMSEQAYSVIDEIKKNQTRITVIREQTANGELLEFNTENVILKPKCDAFQILSMGIYDRGDNNEALALNLAFRLSYNVESPIVCSMEPPRLTDRSVNLQWCYDSDMNQTSPLRVYRLLAERGDENSSKRLPSLTELTTLLSKIEVQRRSGDDCLSRLNWPCDDVCILTDSSFVDSDSATRKHKCIYIRTSEGKLDFWQQDIGDGDIVCVFWVENLQKPNNEEIQ